MSDAKSITATFVQTYDLTVNIVGEGTVSEVVVNTSRTTNYDTGTTVILTAQASEGWEFTGWTGDINSTDPQVQTVISEPKSIIATFKKSYELTINIIGEGEVIEEVISTTYKTSNYIDAVLARLTVFGAIYLTLICLLPLALINFAGISPTISVGGTSVLIIVVVLMDFMAQVQSHMMSTQYSSLMKKANLKNYKR